MGRITGIDQATRHGEDGFIVEYELNALSKQGARGRAVGRLAASFPVKAMDMEVVEIGTTVGDPDRGTETWVAEVFMPETSRLEEMTTERFMGIVERLS